MDLNALRYFRSVVREGNFTKASIALRIAQPAISRMVKRLEEDLGGPLLIRHKRFVELTTLGNVVFRHSETIFQNEAAIERLRKGPSHFVGGTLTIATADPIASLLLPTSLATFSKKFPQILPVVHVGAAEPLLRDIARGNFDCGLFFYIPPQGAQNVDVVPLRKLPFRLVVATPFKRNKETLSSFIGSREVDSLETQAYPTLKKLQSIYPDARIRFSSNHFGLHKGLVLQGLGVSILPEFLVAQELKERKLTDVMPHEKFHFALHLVLRKNIPPSPTLGAFISHLKQAIVER